MIYKISKNLPSQARQQVGFPTLAAVTKEDPHPLGIMVGYPTDSGRGDPTPRWAPPRFLLYIVGFPTSSILSGGLPHLVKQFAVGHPTSFSSCGGVPQVKILLGWGSPPILVAY
ncbi:hypothetical protein R3P38DRAFT_3201452 [Favolaschia claudopus]|uniref:Uncharacterized protein n=1 Tax=Favolaschia claudopus TaxID=2862362 RepID=A0AAW0AL24_9AGAR